MSSMVCPHALPKHWMPQRKVGSPGTPERGAIGWLASPIRELQQEAVRVQHRSRLSKGGHLICLNH